MCSNAMLVILCCSLLVFSQILPSSTEEYANNTADQPITGYGFDLLMTKLDFLHTKQLQMELGLQERDEELNEKLLNLENVFGWAGHNLTAMQELFQKVLAQQAACANHEQMRKEINELSVIQVQAENAKLVASFFASKYNLNGKTTSNRFIKSCMEAPVNASGGYWLQENPKDRPLEVFCEQKTHGGGWLVIQYRFDGSVDFDRNWADYRFGFGNAYNEHWIGLEIIHQLTSRRPHELMVEFEDLSGVYRYAHYKEFEVGNESEQYVLRKIGGYDGTGGDSLGFEKGKKFSTKDNNNGVYSSSYGRGFWCASGYVSLNGKYSYTSGSTPMHWYTYKNEYTPLAYSRMMIREIQT